MEWPGKLGSWGLHLHGLHDQRAARPQASTRYLRRLGGAPPPRRLVRLCLSARRRRGAEDWEKGYLPRAFRFDLVPEVMPTSVDVMHLWPRRNRGQMNPQGPDNRDFCPLQGHASSSQVGRSHLEHAPGDPGSDWWIRQDIPGMSFRVI